MASNFNFNKVILGGRLTDHPELKQTPNGVMVTHFSLAVNRRAKSEQGEQQADFINITAWRQTAEFICRYFKKGSNICLVGSLQVRSWTDQQGNKRYVTEVIADEAYFCETKSESKSEATSDSGAADDIVAKLGEMYGVPNFTDMGNDDDLPF